MGKWLHRLTNKDLEKRTATCSNCGVVPLYFGGTWRCYYSHNYGSARAAETTKPIGGICEICEKPAKLYFDHDHATGGHRGWICRQCNNMLGFALDDPKTLKKAAAYLER